MGTPRGAGLTLPIGFDNRCGECLLYGAIQGLADGLILINREGRIFHINRRAEALLDLRSSQLIGQRMQAGIRHPELVELWRSAERETDPLTTDLKLPPDTTIRATASLCLSAAGEPIGRALLLHDVTREKRLRIELSDSVARRLVEMTGGEENHDEVPALTGRERQILGLLAAGMSNAAVAARLSVSINTVSSHLKHLYPKIKVANRSQAATYALTHGIRPPSK